LPVPGRRMLSWLALVAVVAIVIGWAAWPGGAPTAAERAHDLATELRCPDCEGLSVADSSTPTARALRTEIRELVDGHRSDARIRRVYIDRYGESILLKPASSGLSVLVWVLPVVVVLAGAAGLVVALRRWGRAPRLRATAADEELVAGVRSTTGTSTRESTP
jgi:cytochrome c-type biogenesis protein CcmH